MYTGVFRPLLVTFRKNRTDENLKSATHLLLLIMIENSDKLNNKRLNTIIEVKSEMLRTSRKTIWKRDITL